MTSTPAALVAAQDLPNAAAAQYTSPANGRGTWVDKATLLNYTAGAITVTVHIVPNAGSPSNSNMLVKAKSLAAGASDLLPELVGKYLRPGESIQAFASAATSVSFAANGRELT